MPTAIEFNNISKLYRLGLVSSGTLSNDLKRWWQMNILGKEDPFLKVGSVNDRSTAADSDYVWALKDIDFKVEQGDVVGIIGKNGAGKSTLLKLLSKVTAPTTGTIKAKGRIASLLEVGTGFHPEMTGRENIYMNGTILGMTKKEIDGKLDEIVDFSGWERYIDTPVKRYSSGMTVRLGFAVAAHLDPEILVVDEVLAVGDAEFQKKAIGKMQDVSRGEGRTVLFVSHNLVSIARLCHTGLLLNNGTILSTGKIDAILSDYKKLTNYYDENADLIDRRDRQGNGSLIISDCYIDSQGNKSSIAKIGDSFKLCATLLRKSSDFINGKVHVAANICNADEVKVLQFSTRFIESPIEIKKELTTIEFAVEKLPVIQGDYYVRYYVDDGEKILDWIDHAFHFVVENGDFYGRGDVENSAALLVNFSCSIC